MRTLDDAERGGPAAGDASGGTESPRTPGDPLDRVLDHLRRHVRADAAIVALVDRDRTTVDPIAAWYAFPELDEALTPLLRRPYDRERPGLIEATLERGGPLLLPRLEDWEAAAIPGTPVDAAVSRAWDLIRRASAAAAPIRTALGRTLGALAVLSLDEARPLGRADLDMVTVLADLAALARERAELLAAEAEQRRQEVLLKRAAEGTSATLEPDAVERAVVAHAAQILAADGAQLSRVRAGSQRLASVARHGEPPEVDAATLGEVVRARNAVVHDGDAALAHVPIELGPRLFGVLSIARTDGRRFDPDELALAGKVARIAAAAIANAEAFQQ
ncbi:MAG: GAF domain-containing protein [Solirubrobacterales bacterium]|nr:GAF domain-containing protein [Solirubrobacterales bacterium]